MTDEERPVHHTFDCSTGETTKVPVTDEELADMAERDKANTERLDQEKAEDEALRQAVMNHNDPVVKALAAKLGIQ